MIFSSSLRYRQLCGPCCISVPSNLKLNAVYLFDDSLHISFIHGLSTQVSVETDINETMINHFGGSAFFLRLAREPLYYAFRKCATAGEFPIPCYQLDFSSSLSFIHESCISAFTSLYAVPPGDGRKNPGNGGDAPVPEVMLFLPGWIRSLRRARRRRPSVRVRTF